MEGASVLVARFPDAEAGRAAVVELERHGVVDAERMSLQGLADPGDEPARRGLDFQTGARTGRQAMSGLAIGAVAGAVVVGGATWLLGVDPQPAAPLGAVVGGSAFGGSAGFYYSVATRLPVTDGAAEAADGTARPVELVIQLGPSTDEDTLRPHLEASGAQVIETP